MNIVALIAAYNEADVIGQVIGDLIAQGVSVYLIDHGSTDGTAEVARAWSGRGLVGVERFPDESGFSEEHAASFAWDKLLERKQQLAALLDADWFLHSDADELRESPFPDMALGEALAMVDRMGYNAVDFAVLNFAPTDEEFEAGTDLRAHFRWYEPAQVFDKLQIKCWKKQPAVDLRSSGGHEASFPGRRVFPIRFLDRHYPIRSQAHGERKVFAERKARFVDMERQRGWHVQYDAIAPGHSFRRDPAELRQFDPLVTRHELFDAHRGAEAADARAREVTGELADRRRDLATRERQVDEWQREALTARRAAEDARDDAVATRRAVDDTRRDLEAARHAVEDSQRDREMLRRALADAESAATTARRELERARADEERLRERMRGRDRDLDNAAARLLELRGNLERRLEEAAQLRRRIDEEQRARAAEHAQLDALADQLRGAEIRIDDIYASRTWRWTAPGRLLWSLLRRR